MSNMEVSSFANRISTSHPHTAAAIGTLLQTVPELKDIKVAPSSTKGFEWDAVLDSKTIPLWLLAEHQKTSDNALFFTACMFATAIVQAKNGSLSASRQDTAVHKMVTENWHIAAPEGYDEVSA